MGYKNAPACFQRILDDLPGEHIGKIYFVYVDDISIFSKTESDHVRDVRQIIEQLNHAGLKGNKEKCLYMKKKINFLGHHISENEIRPLEEKKDEILRYEAPKDVEGIRRFLGILSYYRRFIPNCAKLTAPLTLLTRKEEAFTWGQAQKGAFQRLKESLNSGPVLQQPDFEKGWILDTDVCNEGLGAILMQKSDQGELHPISYASRTLVTAEKNYSITEKEILAALWAMEHFHYYLYGREFILRTDHKALEAFTNKGYLESARIQR